MEEPMGEEGVKDRAKEEQRGPEIQGFLLDAML
jgi:hypothetical protein